jgi:hypothetical protein
MNPTHAETPRTDTLRKQFHEMYEFEDDGGDSMGHLFQKYAELERELSAKCAELERVKGERDAALSDPMNAGWEHAQYARKDRENAIGRLKNEIAKREHAEQRATTAEAALARANACINAFNRYFDDDDKTLLDDIRREHAEAIKDAAIDAARTK